MLCKGYWTYALSTLALTWMGKLKLLRRSQNWTCARGAPLLSAIPARLALRDDKYREPLRFVRWHIRQFRNRKVALYLVDARHGPIATLLALTTMDVVNTRVSLRVMILHLPRRIMAIPILVILIRVTIMKIMQAPLRNLILIRHGSLCHTTLISRTICIRNALVLKALIASRITRVKIRTIVLLRRLMSPTFVRKRHLVDMIALENYRKLTWMSPPSLRDLKSKANALLSI